MYLVEDLFDKRSVVGIKLEQFMLEKGCTKIELCKNTGVSRPTLDKLLSGTLTNKTNYEKHVKKVLEYLAITPDVLLGNVKISYNRTRELKNILKISSDEISDITGIPLERLKDIEAGKEATLAELRDIAMCLSVSVNCLKGRNFFEPQISEMDYFFGTNDSNYFSGYWGHIGVAINNTNTFHWFPIDRNVRKMLYDVLDNEKIVVPCMNNKVLLLNMNHIKEIVLLDEACDQPNFIEWDYHVDCGEMPLVVYDALEDYVLYENHDDKVLSKKMIKFLSDLMKKKCWTEEDVNMITDLSNIYYSDGVQRPLYIDFTQDETITDEIMDIYIYEAAEYSENILYCEDTGGAEIILNIKNIAMIEAPLLKVENKVLKKEEDLI
ncbi:MAG: helix-turn-helix transcriptional regulator [Lachnospiraceae bacterium]|nr:helix-turn-helix transcriptional regulator [Lachnospiraceae bacterium]